MRSSRTLARLSPLRAGGRRIGAGRSVAGADIPSSSATTAEGCLGCLWIPLSLVQPLLKPNQEVVGEDNHGHVVVPAAPEAEFVVIHPQFSLSLGEACLNGPAHAADPHEGPQRGRDRRATQVDLQFRLLGRAADDFDNVPGDGVKAEAA